MSEPEAGAPGPTGSGAAPVLADLRWVVACFLLAGILGGVLWAVLVTPAKVTRVQDGIAADTIQMTTLFPMDGWYALIAMVLGLAAGVTLALLRRRDPLLMVVLVALGASLAAYVMKLIGIALGPADPVRTLAKAALGTVADAQLRIDAWVVYLVWPLAATAGVLVVLLFTSSKESDVVTYSSSHESTATPEP